eukprot:g16868.t1
MRLAYFVFNRLAAEEAKAAGDKFPRATVDVWTTHGFAKSRLGLERVVGTTKPPLGDLNKGHVALELGMKAFVFEKLSNGPLKSYDCPREFAWVDEAERAAFLRKEKKVKKAVGSVTQLVLLAFARFCQGDTTKVKSKAHVLAADLQAGSKSRWKRCFNAEDIAKKANALWAFVAKKIWWWMTDAGQERNSLLLRRKGPKFIPDGEEVPGRDKKNFANTNAGVSAIPHDAYLKAFQLQEPNLGKNNEQYCYLHPDAKLVKPRGRDKFWLRCSSSDKNCTVTGYENYDYMIVDECQDMTPCQAALFWKHQPHCAAYLLGDQHQRIYAWRGAKKDFEQTPAVKDFPLSQSFRFGPLVGEFAQRLLNHVARSAPGTPDSSKISGVATVQDESVENFRPKQLAEILARDRMVVCARSNKGLVDALFDFQGILGRWPRWKFVDKSDEDGGGAGGAGSKAAPAAGAAGVNTGGSTGPGSGVFCGAGDDFHDSQASSFGGASRPGSTHTTPNRGGSGAPPKRGAGGMRTYMRWDNQYKSFVALYLYCQKQKEKNRTDAQGQEAGTDAEREETEGDQDRKTSSPILGLDVDDDSDLDGAVPEDPGMVTGQDEATAALAQLQRGQGRQKELPRLSRPEARTNQEDEINQQASPSPSSSPRRPPRKKQKTAASSSTSKPPIVRFDTEEFDSFDELLEYCSEFQFSQAATRLWLIQQYGEKTEEVLAGLQEVHSDDNWEVKLGTVHALKGMEFNECLYLAADFHVLVDVDSQKQYPWERKTKKHFPNDCDKANENEEGRKDADGDGSDAEKDACNGLPQLKECRTSGHVEAMNLLYVAVTRAKRMVRCSAKVWLFFKLLQLREENPSASEDDYNHDHAEDEQEPPRCTRTGGRAFRRSIDPNTVDNLRKQHDSLWDQHRKRNWVISNPYEAAQKLRAIPWPPKNRNGLPDPCELVHPAVPSEVTKKFLQQCVRRYHPDKWEQVLAAAAAKIVAETGFLRGLGGCMSQQELENVKELLNRVTQLSAEALRAESEREPDAPSTAQQRNAAEENEKTA